MNQNRRFPILILVMVLCTMPAVWLCRGPAWAVEPAAAPTPMAQAVAAIKLKPSWDRIELEEEPVYYSFQRGPPGYSLTLYYKASSKNSPPGQTAVTADTKEIARAVLAQLVKEGRNPAKESISVSVLALQEGFRGETGTALVKPLGSTRYDPSRDQLEFRAGGR